MRKIFFITLAAFLFLAHLVSAQVQSTANEAPLYQAGYSPVYEDGQHVAFQPLSKERLIAIDKLEGEWDGLSKDDIIKFTIQTYPQKYIDTYMALVIKKLKNFPKVLPTNEQEKAWQKHLTGPQTRQSVYEFMMLMTKEQILTVGY